MAKHNATRSQLDSNGYCGPFALADTAALDPVRSLLAQRGFNRKDRHTDCAPIRQVFLDESLQEVVHDLIPEKWLLWRSNFFLKEERSGEIGWHHDKHFQADNDEIDFDEIGLHLSLLIALDDMHERNGAFEVIPGSHRNMAGFTRDSRPFHLRSLEEHFLDVPASLHCQGRIINLERGQFLVFHSALLHRSLPYTEGNSRASMIGRLVRTDVKLPEYLRNSEAVMPFTRLGGA